MGNIGSTILSAFGDTKGNQFIIEITENYQINCSFFSNRVLKYRRKNRDIEKLNYRSVGWA